MRKLCVVIYMLFGAVLGLWLTLVRFWLYLWGLVGEDHFLFASIAGSLLMSCLFGFVVNRIWAPASQWQRATLVALGGIAVAVLFGVALTAAIYSAAQRG